MILTQRASRCMCVRKFRKSVRESLRGQHHPVNPRQRTTVLHPLTRITQRHTRMAYQALLPNLFGHQHSLMQVSSVNFHSESSPEKRNVAEMYLTIEKFTVDVNDQSQEVPGEKGVRQSKIAPPGVFQEYAFEDAKTLAEAMRRGHKVSNNGPCLGWRDSNSEYKWLNYGEGIDFVGPGDKLISYLPMAHMLDRLSQMIFYLTGGSVGFFRGDAKLLLEDLDALKPTMMSCVPRILNKIYDKVQNEVKGSPFKKFLLDSALRAKKAEIESGLIRNTSLWDRLVLKKIQNIFGGQMRLLVSAGAPISYEVISFYRYGLGCVVIEAFGQTEMTAACSITAIGDTSEGAVGPPLPCSFVKLADVPEMGYFAKNNEGEVLIKGPTVTKGYFKDPVRTAEIIDEDGWLHSGDIGKWLKNGSLAVIDRKKNLLKLSQGEYISSEKVESVYLFCPFVEQIYVHGEPLESCLVAIVFPEKEVLMSWCAQEGITGEWKDICENEVVKRHILKEMSRVGKENKLKGFEQVKSIYLYPEAFTMKNNLLTVTLKLRRREFRQIFKEVIEKMYADLKKEDSSKIYSKEANSTS